MIDTTAMIEDMLDSDEAFRKQFDRSDPTFHAGIETPVPLGGGRVPESMGGAAMADWRALPEDTLAIEPEYPPEYHSAMETYEKMGKVKKAISIINKPVENAMKIRHQYQEAEGEDKTAMESRLNGAEKERDGALASMKALFDLVDGPEVSDRSRSIVKEVYERGHYDFQEKDAYGEYMTALQRCNQAIFADQKLLLQKIKDMKKAARGPAPPKEAEPATSGADPSNAGA